MQKKQRQFSDQDINELEPTVWIGKNGLTDKLLKEIDMQLKARGYIKVKILKNKRDEYENILGQILKPGNGVLVKKVGLTFVLKEKEE